MNGYEPQKPLTAGEMQRILFSHYLRSDIIICPNTEAIGWEADLVVVQPTDYVAEIEIKISRSDFKADFKKEIKHQQLAGGGRTHWRGGPNQFFYAVPAGMVRLDEVPAYAGLIYVHAPAGYGPEYHRAEVMRAAPRLHTRKADTKLLRRITRSLMYKTFSCGLWEQPEHAALAWQPEEEEVAHD
jgi:hypothetical protein